MVEIEKKFEMNKLNYHLIVGASILKVNHFSSENKTRCVVHNGPIINFILTIDIV
jgi:hypothetical protein